MERRELLFSMLLLSLFGSGCSPSEPEKKELLQSLISDIELIQPSPSSQAFDSEIVATAREISNAAENFKSNDEMVSYLRKQIDSDFAQHRLGIINGVTMPRTDVALQYLKVSLGP